MPLQMRHEAMGRSRSVLTNSTTCWRRYNTTRRPFSWALRVHLETLLQALLEGKVCTREEVRDFVKELERDAPQYDEN
jgi:hypothetical protein